MTPFYSKIIRRSFKKRFSLALLTKVTFIGRLMELCPQGTIELTISDLDFFNIAVGRIKPLVDLMAE